MICQWKSLHREWHLLTSEKIVVPYIRFSTSTTMHMILRGENLSCIKIIPYKLHSFSCLYFSGLLTGCRLSQYKKQVCKAFQESCSSCCCVQMISPGPEICLFAIGFNKHCCQQRALDLKASFLEVQFISHRWLQFCPWEGNNPPQAALLMMTSLCQNDYGWWSLMTSFLDSS